MNRTLIIKGTEKLNRYIETESYRGYDPYDGIKSSIFKLPVLKSNKILRFGVQQFVKRFPLNLRPLLFIKKGYNPVTLGLCLQAYSNLLLIYPDKKDELMKKSYFLIDELEKLIPSGYSGACWGYDFDWEARYSKIPAYQPTIVATGFITNALFKFYQITNYEKSKQLCIDSSHFILKDINRTYEGNDFCFSYSPFDKQEVFNASMKGVRTLSQVYSITNEEELKVEAKKAVNYIIKYQTENGSWKYSKSKTGGWIDNYHTGYVIDCLDEYIKLTGDNQFKYNLLKGYIFYKNNFFHENKIPKFYNKELYPVDCTAAGQSLLTLCRFNDLELAENVAKWMIENMQSEKGYFYFRKFKNYTVKTSFMRWSNAWMFAGLTELLKNITFSGN